MAEHFWLIFNLFITIYIPNFMTQTIVNQGGEDPLQEAKAFVAKWMNCMSTVQEVLEENEQLKQRVTSLESENAALTEMVEQWKNNDEWS